MILLMTKLPFLAYSLAVTFLIFRSSLYPSLNYSLRFPNGLFDIGG